MTSMAPVIITLSKSMRACHWQAVFVSPLFERLEGLGGEILFLNKGYLLNSSTTTESTEL